MTRANPTNAGGFIVVGLITPDEEEKLFRKLVDYYKKLYLGIEFRRQGKLLTAAEVREIYYTYPGEETQATAAEKTRMISEAISHGYATPLILLAKGLKFILLDGHRRVQVAVG
jgi:hypothetical protein